MPFNTPDVNCLLQLYISMQFFQSEKNYNNCIYEKFKY